MPEETKKNRLGRYGGLAIVLAILSKLKTVGLFLVKLLKFGKLGPTIWSMALSVGVYTLIYPWQFAVGLVLMLFIHEMGHVLAARKVGLPVSLPAFIPFFGALIMLKKQPADARTEAFVAFGGPLFGSLGAMAALTLGYATDRPYLFLIAWVGFFLNLINLLPIHPLDGGRIVTAISRWLWLIGLIGGLIVIIYLKAIVFLLIWLLFAWELYQAYFGRKDETLSVVHEFPLAPSVFTEAFFPVPGEAHRRALDFRQYTNLKTRETKLEVDYPGLGRLATLDFDAGAVTAVEMLGYRRLGADDGRLRLFITFRPDRARGGIVRDPTYYQVPLRMRIVYGVAYFGLMIFLGAMLALTAQHLPLDR